MEFRVPNGQLTVRQTGVTVATAGLLLLGGVVVYGRATADPNDQLADNHRRPDSSTPSSANLAIPVEASPVLNATLGISVSATGQAAPSRHAVLFAQVAGRVQALSVREGDRAGSGGFLLALDPAEFRLAVEDARARLSSAQAQYRELTLFDDRIQDSAIRSDRQSGARAKSGVDVAEVALRRALFDLARARSEAPFTGIVASVKVTVGQHVRAGDEMLTVQALDPIKVEVQVLESEIGYLARGREASVAFAAFPNERFIGRIETINPVVESDTRTARVTVIVPNRAGRILPGMYARVALAARQFTNRILVARSAILERDRRTMLFVYDAADAEGEGRANWRYVTTGIANDSLVEIVPHADTEMVQPGQLVLTEGHHTLIHGARIRVVSDAERTDGRTR